MRKDKDIGLRNGFILFNSPYTTTYTTATSTYSQGRETETGLDRCVINKTGLEYSSYAYPYRTYTSRHTLIQVFR